MVTVRQALGKKAAECKEAWEVRPGAHYAMGGIRVDESTSADAIKARKPVSGLFAAGQAMGGVFGANRLGSTSLSEGAIFGARAGLKAAELSVRRRSASEKGLSAEFEKLLESYQQVFGQVGDRSGSGMIRKLQKAAWDSIGPVRTQEGLKNFLSQLKVFRMEAEEIGVSDDSIWNQSFIDYVEFVNMLDTAEAVAVSALERKNSLGAHIRLDGGKTSVLFGQPYSVAVFLSNMVNFETRKLNRPSTPWRRVLANAYFDQKRKLGMKILRVLPSSIQDKIVWERFRAVMGELPNEDGGKVEIEEEREAA
jgi:aspartate oxidase